MKIKRAKPTTPQPTPAQSKPGFVLGVITPRTQTVERKRLSQGGFTAGRISLTTENELTQSIAFAQARGDLPRLHWFVEVKIPGEKLGSRTPVITAALHPGGALPIIPVGPEPVLSRAWADLLLAAFRDYNYGLGLEFAVNVAVKETFAGYGAYEWGDALDAICGECGAVFQHTAFVDLCDECRQRTRTAEEADRYTAQWRMAVLRFAVQLQALGWRSEERR